MKLWDVAGYTYCADNYCPTCIVSAMQHHGIAAPAASDMNAEDVLDQCAGAMGIDREDEYSFDSDEFPKVILLSQIDCGYLEGDEHERCGMCGETLCGEDD